MLTDIELFECFNVELPNGRDLWEIRKRKNSASRTLEKQPGEPGTKERIAQYRKMVENGQPIFEE